MTNSVSRWHAWIMLELCAAGVLTCLISLLSFQMSQKRFRAAAMLFVFTVSAVVHEYILAICFGFFYPVLFCLFMCFGSKKNTTTLYRDIQTHDQNISQYTLLYWTHIMASNVSKHLVNSWTHHSSTLVFFLHPLTVMFNFILHDQRKGPIWNIIMWTSLFLGQGVIICLYSHEWYAQRYCPLKEVTPNHLVCPVDMLSFFFHHGYGVIHLEVGCVYFISLFLFLFQPSFLELLKPRSWSCQRGLMVDSDDLWPVSGLLLRTITDQYKSGPTFCYFHNLWSLIYFLFYCTKAEFVYGCREEVQ